VSQEFDSVFIHRGEASGKEVAIGPSKHAGNAVLGAAALAENVEIGFAPSIGDFHNLLSTYESLGAQVEREDDVVRIHNANLHAATVPDTLVKDTRASFLLLSSALLRTGSMTMPVPQGDWPNTRSNSGILNTFRSFGTDITETHGQLQAELSNTQRRQLYIDVEGNVFPTLIAMTMAAGIGGEYKLTNPLSSPEVDNLADLLVAMGVEVAGLDTDAITVRSDGMKNLRGDVRVDIVPDVCETVFWLAYAALHETDITCTLPGWKGHLSKRSVGPLYDAEKLLKRTNIALDFSTQSDKQKAFTIVPPGKEATTPFDVIPPYHDKKGQPRDAMPHMVTLFGALKPETLYWDDKYAARRTVWVGELAKLGASVVYGNNDVVRIQGKDGGGYEPISSHTSVVGTDIRSAASLLLAASVCKSPVQVEGLRHVNRAYTDLLSKMSWLGTEVVWPAVPD
jgi:UDP-N-acetylglucosamine 1-carboxyvinyltransferase